MSGFSKKLVTEAVAAGNGSAVEKISNDQWGEYNELVWNTFDVASTKLANGKEIKEYDVIGYVKFIMELGQQPQEDASMNSNLPVPKEGEANSPEELERIKKFPLNYFTWEDEYKDGVKSTKRKVHWPKEPEETLIIAVDFPSLKLDYNKHPASTETSENIKPMRIDYNGKWKGSFNREISNKLDYKTGKLMSDKALQYKIATACGNLAEYQNDQHDLAHLVNAVCNWSVKMTKNVTDKGTYYSTEIKDPSPIQDVKGRQVYTVKEQLEDNPCNNEFCGILFHGGEYSKEQLVQVRPFWWSKAVKATQFDRNKGTNRDGEWLIGMNWEDSDLFKAVKEFGIELPTYGNSNVNQPAQQTPKQEPKKEVVNTAVKAIIVKPADDVDFDDDIPF